MSQAYGVPTAALRFLAVVLAIALTAPVAAPAPAQSTEIQTLEIVSKTGVHVFTVELATTDDERAKGLMFRRELAEGRGMLFDFDPDHEAAMWMQNTYVSLDMIFIRPDGRILRIEENTEPLSTRIIPAGGRVRAVLEVVAGTAKKFGIEAGDKVAHPWFDRR